MNLLKFFGISRVLLHSFLLLAYAKIDKKSWKKKPRGQIETIWRTYATQLSKLKRNDRLLKVGTHKKAGFRKSKEIDQESGDWLEEKVYIFLLK